jgi:hypothetical protein
MVDKEVPMTRHAQRKAPRTDGIKHGQGLLARIEERRHELEVSLAHAQAERIATPHEEAIETSLNALDGILTDELDDLSEPTAAQLNKWLESTRFLPEQQRAGAAH